MQQYRIGRLKCTAFMRSTVSARSWFDRRSNTFAESTAAFL